jgi:hypothetical protein
MTSEILASLAPALAAVLVVAMLCAAGLSAWRGWLSYKTLQIETARPAGPTSDENDAQAETDTGVRIELAAVKERLRQLEAIASGVEL